MARRKGGMDYCETETDRALGNLTVLAGID